MTVDDTAGVGPPEQRLREQDMDALHAEVLFPNMQVGPRLWSTLADQDVYRATVRAYNDWLGEEYCAVSRDRLIGLGVIPWTNVDDAIAELEHCAKLGLKGVNLGVFPSGKAYPSPADDRFWAAAVDMKMPLTVHVGFDRLGPRASQPTFEYPGADPAILAGPQLQAHRRQLAAYEHLYENAADLPRGMRLALEVGIGHEREYVRFWSRLSKDGSA